MMLSPKSVASNIQLGRCRLCGKPIKVGDEINYSKESGASHIGCAEQGELLESSEASKLADELGFTHE